MLQSVLCRLRPSGHKFAMCLEMTNDSRHRVFLRPLLRVDHYEGPAEKDQLASIALYQQAGRHSECKRGGFSWPQVPGVPQIPRASKACPKLLGSCHAFPACAEVAPRSA